MQDIRSQLHEGLVLRNNSGHIMQDGQRYEVVFPLVLLPVLPMVHFAQPAEGGECDPMLGLGVVICQAWTSTAAVSRGSGRAPAPAPPRGRTRYVAGMRPGASPGT